MIQDFRKAVRQLWKAPGFSAVALLTLAFGIGANTAIFSVVNGVLLRPLSFRDPAQLYLVREIVPQMAKSYPLLAANIPDFRIWQEQCRSFEGIAIAEDADFDMTGTGEPERLRGLRSSSNFFDVLDVHPVLGRSFVREEDEAGRGHVVMLSDRFWRRHFRSDPSVIGKQLMLDGELYAVIGVLPPSFHVPALAEIGEPADVFQPLNGIRDYESDLIGEFDFAAIARLKDGVGPDQALAELNVVQGQIAKKAGGGVDLKAAMFSLESQVVGGSRPGLLLLLVAVGGVLLIVCVNLANLSLARMPARIREEAIRAALGASKWQLFRRTLSESLFLCLLGGMLGIGFATQSLDWLLRLAPAGIPRLDEVHIDVRVLGFAVLLSFLTGVVVGALPAWRAASSDPLETLKSGTAASGESRHALSLRKSLIGVEVAVSTLLLLVAGLLTSSLIRLLRVDAGFRPQNVMTAGVSLPRNGYSDRAGKQHFYSALLERLRTLPGVSSAAWVTMLPLTGEGSVTGIDIPPAQNAIPPLANYRSISPDYFAAMGIPIIHGRVFGESDRGRKVVVVSKNVADRFWPGEDPVGRKCLTYWGPEEADEVIGVVGDVHTSTLETPPVMMVYVPDWFGKLGLALPPSASIVMRTTISDPGSPAAMRQVIRATEPEATIVYLRPMSELVSKSAASRRYQMVLLQVFALCAVLLMSLGVYGVIAYSVEQRRRELGIRAAFGARLSDLVSMLLRQGLAPVFAGMAAGILAFAFISKLIASLLFGVGLFDPVVLATVLFFVGVVASAACVIPAQRAAKVDPMVALRYE